MRCVDDAVLWQAAEGDLSAEVELQDHLQSCAHCSERLATVRQTRAVLQSASGLTPSVDWARADRQVLGAAAAKLSGQPWWKLPTPELRLGAVGALAALLVAVWVGVRGGSAVEAPLVDVAAVALVSTVEAAEGAQSGEESLSAGEALQEGARVRTAQGGSAILRLPDKSRARLGAGSSATVVKARADDVGLALESGELVVQAAHVPRQAFLVDVGVAQVRVVGTAFRVNRSDSQVEVSVAEGRVLVEPREGEAKLLGAGERGVIDPKGGWVQTAALNGEDGRAFESMGLHARVSAAASDDPKLAVAAPVPPVTAPAPQPTKRPRPSSRQSSGSGAVAAAVEKEEQPAHEEWATPEFKAREDAVASARAPGLGERAKAAGLPVTAEGLFLQRAEESLKSGRCGSFLPGLQDVVEVSEDASARERARILKARCHDERLEPVEAEREYRKYLSDFPRGRYASEARRAVELP